jgi:hypothetical protein
MMNGKGVKGRNLSDALGVKAKRVWLNTLETMKLDSLVATDKVSFHAIITNS